MDASTGKITPLRQRMIEDMRMRKLGEKTQIACTAQCASWRSI